MKTPTPVVAVDGTGGKMLTIRQGAKLNTALSNVVWKIAPFTGETLIEITSGVRNPIEQLHLIGRYALQKKIKFPEFDAQKLHDKINIEGQELYTWQRTWSMLLRLNIIINPPLAAICLEDSLRADGSNRNGTLIQGSPHSSGTAFDISGKAGIPRIVEILTAAKTAGVTIKNWLVERENNAVHVNILAEVKA